VNIADEYESSVRTMFSPRGLEMRWENSDLCYFGPVFGIVDLVFQRLYSDTRREEQETQQSKEQNEHHGKEQPDAPANMSS
jgi:hypothetical protein